MPTHQLLPSLFTVLMVVLIADAGRAAPSKLSLGDENPLVATGTTDPIDTKDNKAGLNCPGSNVISKEPTVILDVPAGSKNLQFRATEVSFMVVSNGKELWCGTDQKLEWKGGPAKIFLGVDYQSSSDSGKQYDYGLSIEDLDRPRSLGWKGGDPISLAKPMAEAVIVAGKPVEKFWAGPKLHGCSHHTAAQPLALLNVAAPLTGVQIAAVSSDESIRVALLGPFNDTMRELKAHCFGAGKTKVELIEAGKYAVLLGNQSGEKTGQATLVFSDANTKSDGLRYLEVPGGLDVESRVASTYLPFLELQHISDVETGEALVQEIFKRAPASLLVFTNVDLDQNVANFYGSIGGGTIEYPKSGEPLLNFGQGRYIAADGSVFGVRKPAVLTTTRPSSLAFPKAARNMTELRTTKHTVQTERVFRQMPVPKKGDPIFKASKAYGATIDKYNKCVKKVWKPVEKKVFGLRNADLLTAADKTQLAKLEEKYGKKEKAKCKPARLDKAREKYLKAMHASAGKRRSAAMAEVVAHVSGVLEN